jgi:hypothetical protein
MTIKIISILILISSQVFSQTTDTILKKYDQQFIYRYGSFFMKGGNKLSFSDLKNEFNNKSLSFDLYLRSKKNKTLSTFFRIISTIAIVGVVKAAKDNNSGLAYGIFAGQLGTLFVSQHYRRNSTIDLDRALQIRNRELLFTLR